MKTLKLFLLFTSVLCLFSAKILAQAPWGTTHLFDIRFFDENKGVIIGGQTTKAYVTSDAGEYWSSIEAFPNTMIRGLYVERGTEKAVAVGQWNTIRRTLNAGSSWTVTPIVWDEVNPVHFMGVDVRNGVALAVGEGGKIYRTTNIFISPSGLNCVNLGSKILIQNPVKNEINIKTSLNVLETQIFDLSGKLLTQNFAKKQINVGDLSQGIYLLQINTEEGKVMKKFIKE